MIARIAMGVGLMALVPGCGPAVGDQIGCLGSGDCPDDCECNTPMFSPFPGVCESFSNTTSGYVCAGSCAHDKDCAAGEYCGYTIDDAGNDGDGELRFTCRVPCAGVTPGDGSAGARCAEDTQCDSGRCDNGSKEASCVCEPACAVDPGLDALGGADAASAVAWRELYLCSYAGTACDDAHTSLVFELVQHASHIAAEVTSGVDQGMKIEGELCGNTYQWVDVTNPDARDREEGCWTFSADGDAFAKRSYLMSEGMIQFRCVGTGSRGASSSPPDPPTCAELESGSVDVESCPPPPL